MPRRRIGKHTMLGPGGQFREPLSESAEISEILMILADKVLPNMVPRDPDGIRYARSLLHDVGRRLAALQDQVAAGYHRNPALVIHNPPIGVRRVINASRVVGLMSKDVHEIRYTHIEDGQPYRHEFDDGVQMFAVDRDGTRDIHLTHANGKPLWEDF